MDKGQILCDYRTAKNHKKQIPILAELNACSKEEIIDILTEGGYTQTFNTNGVDIYVKRKEIEDRYANGDDVATLAMAYHISKKAIRTLLNVPVTEDDKPMKLAQDGILAFDTGPDLMNCGIVVRARVDVIRPM